jgi:hypothetical protein
MMAIARKPGSKPAPEPEDAAEQFIAKAGAMFTASTEASEGGSETGGTRDRRKPAMVRFDATLLARVDRAAKRRGVSRSAWIQFTLSKALDDEGAST